MQYFSRKLRILLAELDVQSRDLADLLGKSTQTISLYTSDKHKTIPDPVSIEKLSEYFGLPIEYWYDKTPPVTKWTYLNNQDKKQRKFLEELTPREVEFLEILNGLTNDEQKIVSNLLGGLKDESKSKRHTATAGEDK